MGDDLFQSFCFDLLLLSLAFCIFTAGLGFGKFAGLW